MSGCAVTGSGPRARCPDDPDVAELVTVGHGTASEKELAGLLRDAEVEAVVDVRRFPGSRRHPHVARERLESWLPAAGIDYRWEERLGGRRRGTPGSAHTGLRNTSFRAYADHMGTAEFGAAVDGLLATARRRRVAIMCSESLWWRCHRRLIGDYVALLTDVRVRHLLHDGRLVVHQPTDVVRVAAGVLLYDGGQPTLPVAPDPPA
ncbi:MAG: DUF488 domain-containing protein [Egibacteraceae bacterium]